MPITVNISTAFINDTDTPATYVGQAGKTLQVNVTETGLEFVTASGANIYNTNGTLTGNRTVTGGGYVLNFFDANIKYKGIGSVFSELVSFRNLSNSADTITIYNDGKVYFYQDFRSLGTNYMETIRSPYFVSSGISISNGVRCISRGEIGAPYTSHEFDTDTTITTSGSFLVKVKNGGVDKFTINKDGVINCAGMPTSSAGLSSGDLWSDLGTIKIV